MYERLCRINESIRSGLNKNKKTERYVHVKTNKKKNKIAKVKNKNYKLIQKAYIIN